MRQAFVEGGGSVKGDGSVRTLAGLLDASQVIDPILEAIDALGASAGADDGVRAQRVDKGISVLLAAKVTQELDAAAAKVTDGNLDPDSGAAHNVDEAWAFFDAEGTGLASTAAKRAADFEREGAVAEPVLTALAVAQSAALAGDGAALAEARADLVGALDYIFYLATYKYLDTGGDAVAQAEGETFYTGIRSRVVEADPEADSAIVAAFATDDADSGRAALHRPAVLAALGIDDAERVDRG